MIRNITGGYGIHVSGSVYNAPYIDTTRASAGMVRYTNGNLEVYDGSSWLALQSSYPQVELSGEVESIINWAKAKMVEEVRLKQLATRHPALQDALDQLQHAQEQVQIVESLVTT